MHGDEKSVKDSDLADLAGQYCFSLIAKYVPKHSSCILKNCKIFDVYPARKPWEGGKSVWEENWQLSNLAFLNSHLPSAAYFGGKTLRPGKEGCLHVPPASGEKCGYE